MRGRMRLSVVIALLSLLCVSLRAEGPAMRHRFLAIDESRAKLHFVDQVEPAKTWSLKLPTRCRDYQLIGANQLLLSCDDGYIVVDLAARKIVKELHNPAFKGSASVRRLGDGRTLIGCNSNGITVFELSADDSVLRTAQFPQMKTLRLLRTTPEGTLLFGSNDSVVIEADLEGQIRQRIELPGAKHIYQVLRQPGGNLLVSTGYGSAIVEVAADGKVVRQLGGKPAPAGVAYHFFAGMQVLEDGDIVVCNWTGHGADDSRIAPQLLQFSAAGELRWTWHDPVLAGTLHGVIVLDELDVSRLNDDSSGVLEAR